MAEFGHEFSNGGGMCIDTWGVGPFVIKGEQKGLWRFEDSDRFGPALIGKDGDLLKNPYPGERSPFWRAHTLWVRQGRRTEADGVTCIWHEPKPTTVRKIGRTFFVVENGEEDGATIVLEPIPSPLPDGKRSDG